MSAAAILGYSPNCVLSPALALVREGKPPGVPRPAGANGAWRTWITKPASYHAPRHWITMHVLENGCDIRAIQELLGHRDASTTMIYTHVLNRRGRSVRSLLDGCA